MPMGAKPKGASNVQDELPSLSVHDMSRSFVSTSMLQASIKRCSTSAMAQREG